MNVEDVSSNVDSTLPFAHSNARGGQKTQANTIHMRNVSSAQGAGQKNPMNRLYVPNISSPNRVSKTQARRNLALKIFGLCHKKPSAVTILQNLRLLVVCRGRLVEQMMSMHRLEHRRHWSWKFPPRHLALMLIRCILTII